MSDETLRELEREVAMNPTLIARTRLRNEQKRRGIRVTFSIYGRRHTTGGKCWGCRGYYGGARIVPCSRCGGRCHRGISRFCGTPAVRIRRRCEDCGHITTYKGRAH